MTDTPAEMELFLRAVELDESARQELLESITDPSLRARLDELLDAHQELGDRDPMTVASTPADRSSRLIGRTVDGFRIVGELGRGGMGVVYDAEQQEPKRRVALKTLPLAQADATSERRLEREAETLARLSHAGIAQVYGSGRASELDGLPYVVMERIDGVPVDLYARQHELDARARIELLAAICEALGHAHQRGVIHRDLKPSNVLVTGDGAPKVLDFGIALLLDADTLHTLKTRTGQVIGTLAYMPPEQLSGLAHGSADARIDVYSLGVLGYELLSGRLPVDLPDAPLASAVRQLAEAEPRPLGQVVPALRGDVEVLFGKALSREPERRYGDGAAFAADLRRFLADEPVHARAPSTAYQLRKFVRRHRTLCGAVLAVVLSLSAGLAWALSERTAAQEAQRTAERTAIREQSRAASMARVVDMLDMVIQATTPQSNNGQRFTIEETVDQLAESIDGRYAGDAYALTKAHALLARAMQRRNLLEPARYHLLRARQEFARSNLPTDYDRRFLAHVEAQSKFEEGHLEASITAFERALAMDGGDGPLDAQLELTIREGLAGVLVSAGRDLQRAESLAREALADHPETSDANPYSFDLLARILEAQGRHVDAVAVWDDYIALLRASELYAESLSLAKALQNQGLLLQELGEPERAQQQLRESLAIRRRVLGDAPHSETAIALDNLGCVLRDGGELTEALGLFEEAEQIFRTLRGDTHLDLAVCLSEQIPALRDLGRMSDATRVAKAALAMFERLGDRSTPQHAAALERFVMLDDSATPLAERVAAADRAVAMREEVHGMDHHVVARALEGRAYVKFMAGELEVAAADAKRCRELREPIYGDEDWRTFAASWVEWIHLARTGNLDEALRLNERTIAGTRASAGDSALRLQFYERHRADLLKAVEARDK